MATIDPATMKFPREVEERFWALVQRASEQILGNEAQVLRNYRDRLARASPMERMLAMHDEPIDIAAELAGRPATEHELAKYDEMKIQFDKNWPNSDVLIVESALRPEDFLERKLEVTLDLLRRYFKLMLIATTVAAVASVGAAIAAIILAIRSTF